MFDGDPLGRKKSGVRRYRILRPIDDPNYVIIDLEFDSSDAAESFSTALNNMWRGPDAQRVMVNPELRIAQVIESVEL